MITYEELDHLIEKDVPQIAMLYEDLCDIRITFRESCKAFIDNFVPDWATEDERYDCDLFAEMYNATGEPWIKNNISEIWRDENRNIVFGIDGYGFYIDYFHDEELLQIVEQLSKS